MLQLKRQITPIYNIGVMWGYGVSHFKSEHQDGWYDEKSSPLLLGLLLVVLATLGRHGLFVVLSALTAKLKCNVVTYRNHVQKSMMHV